MENNQLIFRDGSNVFEIGSKLANMIANSIFNDNEIVYKARASLINLNILTKETVTLHVQKGTERICIAEEESPHQVRFTAGVGSAVSLGIGAASTVLLAYMDPETQRIIMENLFSLEPAQDAVEKKDKYLKRLNNVTKTGYATSFGERLVNTACLSVPIFDSVGIAAAISILGPSERLPEKLILNYLPAIQDEAIRISHLLGCSDYKKSVFKEAGS